MALTVTQLTLARGGVPVIEGLSFAVAPGTALVLRGPNGAGKTTVLRAVAGLQRPISGSISGVQDGVAFAGHADGLKAMLSVSENLMFWARVFGRSEIEVALDAYALRPLRDRLAGTLSAGQKRRLGLARLLVTGCRIWVMDEPTVSLDHDTVAQFAGVVRGHLAQGGSALMATHIDLGFDAEVLDIAAYRARPGSRVGASDEAFL